MRHFMAEIVGGFHGALLLHMCSVLWHQGMDIEAAEKWIVDLIRGSKLDAKIDSRDNSVIMGGTFPSVYQQVSNLERRLLCWFVHVRHLRARRLVCLVMRVAEQLH